MLQDERNLFPLINKEFSDFFNINKVNKQSTGAIAKLAQDIAINKLRPFNSFAYTVLKGDKFLF